MRAGRSVDAFFGQPQSRDRDSVDNVGFDNLFHIFSPHASIPNTFRINHNGRPMFALIQATSAVGANSRFQSACRQLFLKKQLQAAKPFRVATTSGVLRRTLVGADKNMMFKPCHIQIRECLKPLQRDTRCFDLSEGESASALSEASRWVENYHPEKQPRCNLADRRGRQPLSIIPLARVSVLNKNNWPGRNFCWQNPGNLYIHVHRDARRGRENWDELPA